MSAPSHPEHTVTVLDQAQRLYCQFQFNARAAARRYRLQVAGLVGLAVAIAVLAARLVPEAAAGTPITQAPLIWIVAAGLGLTVLLISLHRRRYGGSWRQFELAAAQVQQLVSLARMLPPTSPESGPGLPQQLLALQQDYLPNLDISLPPVTADGRRSPLPAVLTHTGAWSPGQYVAQRLQPEIERLAQVLMEHQRQRQRLQGLALACGGVCVLLPVLGGEWLVGVAAAAPLGLGLTLWRLTLHDDDQVARQQTCLLQLMARQDNWQSWLQVSTPIEGYPHLVVATEAAIAIQFGSHFPALTRSGPDWPSFPQGFPSLDALPWRQQTQKHGSLAQETLAKEPQSNGVKLDTEQSSLAPSPATDPSVVLPKDADTDLAPLNPILSLPAVLKAPAVLSPSPAVLKDDAQGSMRGKPHAFVVMPFGRKQRGDGSWVDFNAIYEWLIKPAIETAGFESFRADEETCSGDILTDMFQELLLADVVIADLSIDNANVFYELGVRHAMRRRGIVHIQAGRAYMPFDIFNVRTLPYHCDASGGPDPTELDKDRTALVKMIQSTWQSDHNQIHSPIFNLLTGLPEPDRKSLRTPLATGYWEEYNLLQGRITIAQRQKRIGDVVLLAEEVSNPLIKEDILSEAGQALKSMGNSALALKQYRQGLKINPKSIVFCCEEAYHLHCLGQSDEAIVKLERLLREQPTCLDATCYLGLIYQNIWTDKWLPVADDTLRLRIAHDASYLLVKAIECYLRAYRLDHNLYSPGVNALALTALLDHLAEITQENEASSDEYTYRAMLPELTGSIQFCLESTEMNAPNDPWAVLSQGVLAVCTAQAPARVAAVYKRALTFLWSNRFALQDALQQLNLFKQLQFRLDHVQAGIEVLQAEIFRYQQQAQIFATDDTETGTEKPAQVFLFSGHMIDSPNRETPRFPASMEDEARERIHLVLDKLQANSNCLSITPGIACGGDILFIEACLERNMRVEAYLPFEINNFIQYSVSFAGDSWTERFYNIINNPHVSIHLQPERLGPVPADQNAFERNNRWALYSTLVYDINRVRLLVLWNGKGGDAPGGTGDMVNQVRQLGGIVEHIDTTKFDYWKKRSASIESIYQKLEI